MEILLVSGILAAVIGISMTRINRKDTNIKSVVRQFSTTVREIRNRAKLHNSTYRLVINFDEKSPSYIIESSPGKKIRPTKEDLEAIEKMRAEDRPPEAFKVDTGFFKKPRVLPSGLHFQNLETINFTEPQSSGVGYIYFSPEGFVEQSALQISDRKSLTWTLVFHPLTGQVQVIQEAKSLKDLKRD